MADNLSIPAFYEKFIADNPHAFLLPAGHLTVATIRILRQADPQISTSVGGYYIRGERWLAGGPSWKIWVSNDEVAALVLMSL